LFVFQETSSKEQGNKTHPASEAASAHTSGHLHTVTTGGGEGVANTTVSTSILESIQEREPGQESQIVTPFRAHVHRCIVQKLASGKQRC